MDKKQDWIMWVTVYINLLIINLSNEIRPQMPQDVNTEKQFSFLKSFQDKSLSRFSSLCS